MTSVAILGGLLLVAVGCFAACPDPPAFSGLDISKVAGKWYGYKLPAEFQNVYKCGDMDLKPKDDEIVDWTIKEYDVANYKWNNLRGSMHKIGDGKYEGFRVGITGNVKWSILGTDYNNWLVYWQCHETNEKQWAFLMSRTKSLSPDAVQAADKALPPGSYVITEQSDCPGYTLANTFLN
ncbi:beta-lactoglobulin-like [Bacillus rossius redtenbacheri]|uniref:beta-lactoglobulin-like n=1 Tax=Bacillus rossius redtenbacheri TaxID=93214 RepID=UPI002FDE0032